MADLVSVSAAVCLLLTLYFLKAYYDRTHKGSLPLPPGPKGHFLIGNISDLPPPAVPEFQHWFKHKDRYGPLSSVSILGETIVIIHDINVASELMEKRANIHSGRPKMRFVDMIGWDETLGGMQNNQMHKLYRRYSHRQLGSKTAVSRHSAVQEAAVGRFIWRLNQDEGTKLTQHLKTEAGELILKLTYDYTIEPFKRDPLVDLVDEAMAQFSVAGVPGKWAVDILPFLEYLPGWMPGTGFKQTARQWRKTLTDVANIPFEYTKRSGSCGQDRSKSFVSTSIEQAQSENKYDSIAEHAIKWTAASLYTGGADTSVSTMNAFFLAMSMYPGVQHKAQEEIDRVVGTSRLPSFDDRKNLPYTCAIVEEAQRWHPIGPMGLPHATDNEDNINGYRIPRGAILLPSIWWFTRDPDVYHDPEAFKPERFLEPFKEPYATSFTFGFGRRICPGKVLADSSLYLTFVQALAVFKIRKALDGQGKEIEPVHEFGDGIVSYPRAFKIRVTARSSAHEKLIREVVKKHPWEESDAKHLDLGVQG